MGPQREDLTLHLDLRDRLDRDLPRLADRHDVPGASVAVWVDGAVVEVTTGVVNRRTGVDVTPDALFMIQSVTKMWTATAVLQLVDDGLIALDDRIRDHLPDFRTTDPRASEQITVRHLLAHTGGFEGDLWAPTTSGDDALARFVADLVPHAAQRSAPGELYSYSNAGYGVLGRLIEVRRRGSFETALRHHLLVPLGVAEVAFDADQALGFRTAIGHSRPAPGEPARPLPRWAVMAPSNPSAGNTLAMSARALLALGRMHLTEGLAPDGTRVLSVDAVRAMQKVQVSHPGSRGSGGHHGLGWFLPAHGVVEHGGDTIGVAGALRVVPDRGLAVAVLTNSDGGHGLIEDLTGSLLADLAGVPAAPAPEVPGEAARPAAPERWVGRYETRVSRYEVSASADGRLWVEQSWQHEGLDLSARAGLASATARHELRPVEEDRGQFVKIAKESGGAAGHLHFVGRDPAGRARFLHTGRAVPRVD